MTVTQTIEKDLQNLQDDQEYVAKVNKDNNGNLKISQRYIVKNA